LVWQIGAGFYIIAISSTGLALVVLAFLPWVERCLPSEDKEKTKERQNRSGSD
jgi:uncharacterized membrane protein YhiD involved in acid resistance